jgi:purine-binding chemotaxis protein CheW
MTESDRAAAILEERARALARPVTLGIEDHAADVITFAVAGEMYGVEPSLVLEVTRLDHLTPLPVAEPWVAGLTGWRGELILVADLRRLLGAPAAPFPERATLVVLGRGGAELALIADAPGRLEAIARDLGPPPAGIAGVEYLRGMTAEAVLVLDVDRVLGAARAEPAR